MAAFKWTGAVLVLFSAGGLGIWSAMQWKGRLRMLETLRQMIYFLKGEITYSRAPLAECLAWQRGKEQDKTGIENTGNP